MTDTTSSNGAREFVSVDPTTGQTLQRYDAHDQARVETDLQATHDAFTQWRDAPVQSRASFLLALADGLSAEREQLARLATAEMGKPLAEALGEVDKCASTLRYFAEHGPGMLTDAQISSNATESYVGFRPLGVVLAVMPWNFPYWQVVRFAAGALLAGNSVLLKHAENVSGCAFALADVVRRAGGPQGLVTASLMTIPVLHEVIADDRVAAVTLTGSTRAGREVASSAGRALKKSVLELGGSDAFVVLADADLERAAAVGAISRFQNAGQTCIAAKRFVVEAPVLEEFTALLVKEAERLQVGDPAQAGTTMGPMAREDLRRGVHQQVQASVAEGAVVATGAAIPDGAGWFYPPTVLTGVRPDMTVAREEVFGPVATIIEAADGEDALRIANASTFGLGGAIWTTDLERGKHMAQRFESGAVFINGMTASDARLPFGGVKQSGYGRELSAFGIREFSNVQTTWIGPATEPAPATPSE